MFEFGGRLYTAAEMLAANAHDEDVCDFIRSAQPGEVFWGGLVCVQ